MSDPVRNTYLKYPEGHVCCGKGYMSVELQDGGKSRSSVFTGPLCGLQEGLPQAGTPALQGSGVASVKLAAVQLETEDSQS